MDNDCPLSFLKIGKYILMCDFRQTEDDIRDSLNFVYNDISSKEQQCLFKDKLWKYPNGSLFKDS